MMNIQIYININIIYSILYLYIYIVRIISDSVSVTSICNYCIYDYQTMKRYPGNRSCTLVPLTLTPVNIVRRLGP